MTNDYVTPYKNFFGFRFELTKTSDGTPDGYECRGDVCYDDEGDEMPDPELWQAALHLAEALNDHGIPAEAEPSEKGWVEVRFNS